MTHRLHSMTSRCWPLERFLGEDVTLPDVHYGRVPDDDLMDLWESQNCRFYRERFQERVQKHDDVIVNDLVGASGASRIRTMEKALRAMPDPPTGCNVCHYLYDI